MEQKTPIPDPRTDTGFNPAMTKVSDPVSAARPKLTDRSSPPWWWAVLQLAALGFHMPLTVLSGGLRTQAEPESVLMVGTMASVAGLVLYVVLRRFSNSAWRALEWSSVTLLFFWHWSAAVEIGPLPRWLVTLTLFGLVLAAVNSFAQERILKLGFFLVALTLTITPIALAVKDVVTDPDPVVARQSTSVSVDLESRPDITLIVLDGYGRADVIDELYGYDNSPFLDALEEEGFDVARQARANYSITHLSLPSMLNMSYMHPEDALLGARDLYLLAEELGGANQTVEILKENGYTYVHGDAGYSLNTCGQEVDVCLPGPWLDVTMFSLLVNTPIGGLIYPTAGDPSTVLNLARIDQLRNWSSFKASLPEGPIFAFLHLLLPHPPMFLDGACAPRVMDVLDGRIMRDESVTEDELGLRQEAWVEQVKCANLAVNLLLAEADPDELIIITSDHGPDSFYEISGPRTVFTDVALQERFPTLTAVRMPPACRGSLPDDAHLVNLFREVFSCLSGREISSVEGRFFAAGFAGPIFEFKDPNEESDN